MRHNSLPDIVYIDYPTSTPSRAKRILGQDTAAQTLTVVTLIIRLEIVGMLFMHYGLGLNGLSTNIALKFFGMMGSMMVGAIRSRELDVYWTDDPRRAHRALRSTLISYALAVPGAWQFFSIFI